jgi:hypothetical protein
MGLILRALRQVLFQKAAETDHQGKSLLAIYVKVTVGLFFIGHNSATYNNYLGSHQIFRFAFGTKMVPLRVNLPAALLSGSHFCFATYLQS